MQKSRIILVSCLLTVVVGVAILFFGRRTSSPAVTVSFRGFTNDSKGVRLATFCISNASDGSVIRWGHYGVETRQTPWSLAPQPALGQKATIGPGQSESVSLPTPTNAGAWKAVLFYSPDGWISRAHVNTNSILRPIMAKLGWVGVPTEVWTSDWLDK